MSTEVKEFCLTDGCLKHLMEAYFARNEAEIVSLHGGDWCCGNCEK